MTKASIYGGLTVLALCLSGCGSSDSSTEAMASESAMADTGMASDDGGAMMSDAATPMASDTAGMGAASSDAMGGPSAMGSGGAMKDPAPTASSSPMARKAAGQAGQ